MPDDSQSVSLPEIWPEWFGSPTELSRPGRNAPEDRLGKVPSTFPSRVGARGARAAMNARQNFHLNFYAGDPSTAVATPVSTRPIGTLYDQRMAHRFMDVGFGLWWWRSPGITQGRHANLLADRQTFVGFRPTAVQPNLPRAEQLL